ncbi:MAG: anti-sigma F factor [Lachnospiraceae bacterium]|nr:anti-sigma F factor [Lachnospiraceae bacterium]
MCGEKCGQAQTGVNWKNEMELVFDAVSSNESFARTAVAAFISHLNPTLEELADIKTAVSEAVTNAVIHGYENLYGYGVHGEARPAYVVIHPGKVWLHCLLEHGVLHIDVTDKGKGIEDLEQAMEPLFTTKPELERSGMGFAFMEAFMDELEVESVPGQGTTVHMKKKLGIGAWIHRED